MGGDPPTHLNTIWKTLFFISLLHFVWGLATRPAQKLCAQKNPVALPVDLHFSYKL